MEFAGLTWQAWFTLAVVVCMFASLLLTKIKTEVAFLLVVSVLFVSGILDVSGAFGGFSSESVVVVAVLYVVIAGLTYTGVLNWIVKHLMGTPRTLTGAITRLMLPVALLSSLLSNTTVVALFINVVRIWSRKLGIAPSKLLIPLSYASGMGGICTLIGTPPNLIISGLYTEDTGIALSVLTPTLCGLFCLAVGVLSMIAMQKLLPERKSPMDNNMTDDFTAELQVSAHCPYIGHTLGEAYQETGLTQSDVMVTAVQSFDREYLYPVSKDDFIIGGDSLHVIGKPGKIIDFCNRLQLQCPTMEGILEAEASQKEGTSHKAIVSTLILIAMVALSAFKILPLLTCCLLAAIAMVVTKCCSSAQAMRSLDWNIIIVFAGSVAIGKAIETTGLAEVVANGLMSVCGTNPYVVLTVMCLVATFITEFISNTAAGAMFYPIAMTSATALGVNPLTFCVALMISASSSFATPIGSPTHMLVYAPGGYRFSDFARIGVAMNFIILIANVFITTLIFPLN